MKKPPNPPPKPELSAGFISCSPQLQKKKKKVFERGKKRAWEHLDERKPLNRRRET